MIHKVWEIISPFLYVILWKCFYERKVCPSINKDASQKLKYTINFVWVVAYFKFGVSPLFTICVWKWWVGWKVACLFMFIQNKSTWTGWILPIWPINLKWKSANSIDKIGYNFKSIQLSWDGWKLQAKHVNIDIFQFLNPHIYP